MPLPAADAVSRRDEALARTRRATRWMTTAAIAAAVVLSSAFAHALPGHHAVAPARRPRGRPAARPGPATARARRAGRPAPASGTGGTGSTITCSRRPSRRHRPRRVRRRRSCPEDPDDSALVRDPRHRGGCAAAADRGRCARHRGNCQVRGAAMAADHDRRPAPSSVAAGRGVRRRACHDHRPRSLCADRLGRRRGPVHVQLPAAVARPRRGRFRPAPCRAGQQPAAGAARLPQLAGGALAVLRVLAGGALARAGHRHRQPPGADASAGRGLRDSGGLRRRVADLAAAERARAAGGMLGWHRPGAGDRRVCGPRPAAARLGAPRRDAARAAVAGHRARGTAGKAGDTGGPP